MNPAKALLIALGGSLWVSGSDAASGITEEEIAAGVSSVNSTFRPGDGRRYGIVPDDSIDDTVAFERAVAVAMQGVDLLLPPGTIDIARNNLSFRSNVAPFHIQGSGVGKTILRRNADVPGAFMSFEKCAGIEISDLTVDAGHDRFGSGSHGLRLDRCSDIYVHNIEVRNWADTGIIAFDSTRAGRYYDNIRISDVSLDGMKIANNGILFSFTRHSTIQNCVIKDVGKAGRPAFALQLKSRNKWSRIHNCFVTNADAGVAVGSDDVSFPSNTECEISRIFIKDSIQGLHLGHSARLNIYDIHIDMTPIDRSTEYQYAVNLRRVDTSSLTNIHIQGYSGSRQPLRIRNSDGNAIHVARWSNVSPSDRFASFENDKPGTGSSDDNILVVGRIIGSVPAYTADLFTFESNSRSNVARLVGSSITGRFTISNGTVTNPNHGVEHLIVDTERGTASDDLDEISNGIFDGQRIRVSSADDKRDLVLRHKSGNLKLHRGADRILDVTTDTVELEWLAAESVWAER